GWIADQKPSDRHRRHAAAIPNGGAGCELDEPIGSAVPQADAATLPRDFAILDEGGKLLVGLALDRSPAAAFALLRGKLEQIGIEAKRVTTQTCLPMAARNSIAANALSATRTM